MSDNPERWRTCPDFGCEKLHACTKSYACLSLRLNEFFPRMGKPYEELDDRAKLVVNTVIDHAFDALDMPPNALLNREAAREGMRELLWSGAARIKEIPTGYVIELAPGAFPNVKPH